MKLALAALIVAGCTAAATGQSPNRPSNENAASSGMSHAASRRDLLLRLERTSCFGTCPAYVVEVDAQGSLRYEGKANVCTPGDVFGRVSPEIATQLHQAISESRFGDASEKCCECLVTDTPSAVMTIVDAGRSKTIVVTDGCAGPAEIRGLADKFDSLLRTEQWIGTRADRKKCIW
jgi:hypothetical protein